jgi:hypothetical protein
MTNYSKIKSQMSIAEVKLLGKPDFATTLTVAHLANAPEPSEKRCTIETEYILRKSRKDMDDTEDVPIYMFFSREGKLFWAAPQNLPSLKQVGSRAGGEQPWFA